MYRHGDAIARIELKNLLQSCITKTFFGAGCGVAFRAVLRENGFRVAVMKLTTAKPYVYFDVKLLERKLGRKTVTSLQCAKCGKGSHMTKMYLDWDSLSPQCSKCYKIAGWWIPGRKKYEDYDDRARFQRLAKYYFLHMAAWSERRRMSSQTPEEFFAERPYLVPPFLTITKEMEPEIYQKVLKQLARKYRQALRKRVRPRMTSPDAQWFERKMEERLVGGYMILEKESECLKRHVQVHHEMAKHAKVSGKQSGIPRGLWNSRPLAIGYSSSKTPSSPVTSASHAMGEEKLPATTVEAEAITINSLETKSSASNVPPVQEPGNSSAMLAEVKALSSSSQSSRSAVPLPEELSLVETR